MAKKKSASDEWVYLIASRIKGLRKEKGFGSYEDFANEFELDRKQYWRIEKGENITIKTLIRILEIHKKDLPAFFREIERARKE